MRQKLEEEQGSGNRYKFVAFSPTWLWTIFDGRNGFWIPGGGPAWDKIKELSHENEELRAVAYGPGESWVVLYGEAGAAYGNVPKELGKVLDEAVAKGEVIKCVAFKGKEWIVLGETQWWTSDHEMAASRVIAADYKRGMHPTGVVFVPEMGGFNARKFAAILHEKWSGKMAGGYACVVLDHGKLVVSVAEGWARAPWEKVCPSVPMKVTTQMPLASVSKTVTAVAMMRLWEECAGTKRAFSLDDPFWPALRALCPDVDGQVKQITIRQLMTHRSGFAEDPPDGTIAGLRKLLATPLAHDPGETRKYMNVNYLIISHVIEAISGMEYMAYVKQHVLARMGITQMGNAPHDGPAACWYGKAGDRTAGDVGIIEGWYGSAAELARFLEGIRTGKVLSRESTAILFADDFGWDWGSPSGPWGKGGMMKTGNGKRTVSGIVYGPDGVVIAAMANCDDVNTEQVPADAWRAARGE